MLPDVHNPSWSAADIVAEVQLRPDIPPQWAPMGVDLGCGHHGCVFETRDPGVVLKVTDDDTEADVATRLAEDVAPVCVRYHLVLDSGIAFGRKPIMLLWRERAFQVGEILDAIERAGERLQPRSVGRAGYAPPRERASTFIYNQLEAGQAAFAAVYHRRPLGEIMDAAEEWVTACRKMAVQRTSPELAQLGAGMVDVFARHRVLFGDVNPDNIGLVRRSDGERWVITDPGHVAVIT